MAQSNSSRRWLYVLVAIWLIFLAGIGVVLITQGGNAQGSSGADAASGSSSGESVPTNEGGGGENGGQESGGGQNGGQEGGGQEGGGGNGGQGGGGQNGQNGAQGDQVYANQCAQCHGQEGEGASGPALAGNDALQDDQAIIDQILNGSGGMPAFADQLSDDQIAAVATHERTSWGNDYGEITTDQVAQARNGSGNGNGNSSSSDGGGQAEGGGDGGGDAQQTDGAQAGGGQAGGGQTGGTRDGAGDGRGWYTPQQAQAGIQEFGSHCSVCHGGGGVGRAPYPPLVGEEFLANWEGRSAAELFEYTSTEMPDDRPGALGHRTYVNLVAFMLQQNGLPAGTEEFDPRAPRARELVLTGGDGGDASDPFQQEQTGPGATGEEDEGGSGQNTDTQDGP